MGTHVKETDSREKYGTWFVWILVALVGLVSMMLAVTVTVFGNFWVGIFLGALAVVSMARLITYTRDLIKTTA